LEASSTSARRPSSVVEGVDQHADLVVGRARRPQAEVAALHHAARDPADGDDRLGERHLQPVSEQQRGQQARDHDQAEDAEVVLHALARLVARAQVDRAQDLVVADDAPPSGDMPAVAAHPFGLRQPRERRRRLLGTGE
jgi:hypothetical protein